MNSHYSYSTDEEHYHERFDSIEAACNAAAAEVGVGGRFWVGENVDPIQPEHFWNAEDWLEQVSCQDEYGGDWAVDWDESTAEQRKELELEVRAVMANWLDRHDLRPKFWTIEHPQQFFVAGKTGDVFAVEAVASGA